jgi:hypothetical protein
VKYKIDIEVEWVAHVRLLERERVVLQGTGDVPPVTRNEVVQAYDLIALFQQCIAQVGPDKTGAASDKDSLFGFGHLIGLLQQTASATARAKSGIHGWCGGRYRRTTTIKLSQTARFVISGALARG